MNNSLHYIEPTDSGIIESLSRKTVRYAEEQLLLAVLENATEDYQKYFGARDKKGKDIFAGAETWFMADDFDSFYSFVNVCDLLQLNPNYLRRGLSDWRKARERELESGGVLPSVNNARDDDLKRLNGDVRRHRAKKPSRSPGRPAAAPSAPR
jgi:hypothetical protein